MSKRILIFGSNGLLGHKLVEYYQELTDIFVMASARGIDEYHPSMVNFSKCDVSDSLKTKLLLESFKPTHIINSAAYTAVDKAEVERDKAFQVNWNYVEHLANYASNNNAHLIHVSSDYVFDGLDGPYSENAKTNPLGVYGQSKLKGDEAILEMKKLQSTIFRASVVFGDHRNKQKLNFVTWLIRELIGNRPVRIVDDQYGNFTFVDDLVLAIDLAIQKKYFGLYNLASKELMSRFEFSVLIANTLGLNTDLIKPVKTAEFNQQAKRPLRSGLIIDKFIKTFEIEPTPLTNSIQTIYNQLIQEN